MANCSESFSFLMRTSISFLVASAPDIALPIAVLGATGVMLARLGLALTARVRGERAAALSPTAQAQREALRVRLTSSTTYVRMTFVLAALPGMPASFMFPLLGAMRTPLWPALVGTLVGRTPLLLITTSFFAWIGRILSDNDDQAAVTLAMLAIVILVLRTLGQVDWAHREATGQWRFREAKNNAVRMTTMFGGTGPTPATWSATTTGDAMYIEDGVDVIEGELLGEEVLDDAEDDEASGEVTSPDEP